MLRSVTTAPEPLGEPPVVAPVAPFLRWAGSKRWLLPHLEARLPKEWKSYHEPFLGSGAVFLGLVPRGEAYLSDALAPLVQCFQTVRDQPSQVAKRANSWATNPEKFYEIRAAKFSNEVDRAARFIYLNKLCFNGLYRENRSGQFNVPYGRPKSSRIIIDGQLEVVAKRLGAARIENIDFEDSLARCQPESLVYLDPPYVAGHRSNGFVDYNAKIFSWDDQKRLAEKFRQLSRSGVHVLLSNADHPSVRELYPNSEIIALDRYSSMSGRVANRGRSAELLVLSDSLRK
ncbi:hypothetical protein C5E07_17370 [Pseudoclavibacter sp. RFBJ3]|uniref:DNA adenine methylase n=1 Tax=unclassified Pseudoclavibacter TaxID=2615177 RepID=UPI000CE79BF2|nr:MULTISPECIES: Dam family site-specific DNA-(adenine-N6)-methyltransferase [unclassified Pseudoclavibacter]PPF86068.1 hypothetical protein C5C12_02815 [Pseudoclavibacter sp. RFBJ5]PPF89770.1 hypothetical protein C5E07_17370 [Pseudoclavibacter sp. RFBJ3]PPF97340.1 hypothetical protein C5C19_12240 [Pseudoclavibacter sp. RFBH5]PPG19656.1 hypothetical protein C5E13_16255 [Pseudoclavibacter sp. RFBI4]